MGKKEEIAFPKNSITAVRARGQYFTSGPEFFLILIATLAGLRSSSLIVGTGVNFRRGRAAIHSSTSSASQANFVLLPPGGPSSIGRGNLPCRIHENKAV